MEEKKISMEFSSGLEAVLKVLERTEEYAKLFSIRLSFTSAKIFEQLHEDIIWLYAKTLRFLMEAKRYWDKHTLIRYVTATVFKEKVEELVGVIKAREKNIRKSMNLVEMERRNDDEHHSNRLWLQAPDFAVDLETSSRDTLTESARGLYVGMSFARNEQHFKIDEALYQLPYGLSTLYGSIMNRLMKNSRIALIHRVLRFVLSAMRPLRLEVLAFLSATTEGLRRHEDYKQQDVAKDGRDLASLCAPLLVIMPDHTVQLMHISLYLFLRTSGELLGAHDESPNTEKLHTQNSQILIT